MVDLQLCVVFLVLYNYSIFCLYLFLALAMDAWHLHNVYDLDESSVVLSLLPIVWIILSYDCGGDEYIPQVLYFMFHPILDGFHVCFLQSSQKSGRSTSK